MNPLEKITDQDTELMLRVKAGDSEAFSILFEKYYQKVVSLCWRYIQNTELAQDAAQEVFLKIFNTAKKYRPTASFSTYIYRITVNHCLNELREKRRHPTISLDYEANNINQDDSSLLESLPSENQSPREIAIKKEIQTEIRKAISELPEKQRMAIILKRFDNLSYEKIGETMGCSVGAVDSLLQRARYTLLKKLKKNFREGIF